MIQNQVAGRRPVVAPCIKASRQLAPGKLALPQCRKEFIDDAFLDLARMFVLQAVLYFFKKFDGAIVTAADKEAAVDFVRRDTGCLKRNVAIAQLRGNDLRGEPVKLDVDIGPDDDAARVFAQALENQVHFLNHARDKLWAVVMAFPEHLDDLGLDREPGRNRREKVVVIKRVVRRSVTTKDFHGTSPFES